MLLHGRTCGFAHAAYPGPVTCVTWRRSTAAGKAMGEVYTFDNPRRLGEHRRLPLQERTMAYWENPRRRSRRRPRRHNPDGGDGMGASNPGFTSDFTELAKTGLLTTVGFGLAMAVGKVMPNEVKSNIYLSPISKGVAALALLSMKGSIPGGGAVAEQVAAGMATAGVVEAAIKIGGASFPAQHGRRRTTTLACRWAARLATAATGNRCSALQVRGVFAGCGALASPAAPRRLSGHRGTALLCSR